MERESADLQACSWYMLHNEEEPRPARRVRPSDGSGALGDVIARAESLGIQVFAKKDSPFEDVMVVQDGPHRVIVVLGDVVESLAALWIRWALGEEEPVV